MIRKLFLIVAMMNVVVFWHARGNPAEGFQLYSFFVPSSMNDRQTITFNPNAGLEYRKSYEEKYGPNGKDLIEMLGQGSSILKSKTSVYKETDNKQTTS